MTTRFNSNVDGDPNRIDSGYVQRSPVSAYTIPSCGIEDIDKAMFTMFDSEIPFNVVKQNNKTPTKVDVIFSTAERWVHNKRPKIKKDVNGILILPAVSIVRKSIVQDVSKDVCGRGINQHTGKLTIKRALSVEDRNDEMLRNRFGIKNQSNLAVPSTSAISGELSTARETGQLLLTDPDVEAGGWLKGSIEQSGFEWITVPCPQFITVNYEVTLWAQYIDEINQLIETLMSSFLPTGHQSLKLTTNAGYWFIGSMASGEITSESNFNEMSEKERLVKYTFGFTVPAYIFVSSAPGVPIAVHRYVSNPTISFTVGAPGGSSGLEPQNPLTAVGTLVSDPFIGTDDPTLPSDVNRLGERPDGRYTGESLAFPRDGKLDPAHDTERRGAPKPVFRVIEVIGNDGKPRKKHVRIVSQNAATGETVYGSDFLLGIMGITTSR